MLSVCVLCGPPVGPSSPVVGPLWGHSLCVGVGLLWGPPLLCLPFLHDDSRIDMSARVTLTLARVLPESVRLFLLTSLKKTQKFTLFVRMQIIV